MPLFFRILQAIRHFFHNRFLCVYPIYRLYSLHFSKDQQHSFIILRSEVHPYLGSYSSPDVR